MPALLPGSKVEQYIVEQIATHGPVSFRWFMDKALYHPEFGYYISDRQHVGKRGDYFTNVCVGRIYGDLIGKQVEQMWKHLGSPASFAVVEQGAHFGQFAHDLLTWLHSFSPECYEAARYWFIEPSEDLAKKQQETCEAWPAKKLNWIERLENLDEGSIMGIYFSNELLDAFPVHMVTRIGGEWMENFVDCDNGKFKWVYQPPSTPLLEKRIKKLPDWLPDGYRTEVNTAALRWIEDIAHAFMRGYILTVDYGFPRSEYYHPDRTTGTLSCYASHTKFEDPFKRIGRADITAHVDWTSLAETAEENFLDILGFTDQHHFIVGLGREELLTLEREVPKMTPELQEYVRTFRMLMHPETMGTRFQALCLGKNVPTDQPLDGFQYSADPRHYLELDVDPAS